MTSDFPFGQPIGASTDAPVVPAPKRRRRKSKASEPAAPAKRRGRPPTKANSVATDAPAPKRRGRPPSTTPKAPRAPRAANGNGKLTAVHLLTATAGLQPVDRQLFGEIVAAVEKQAKLSRQRIAVALKELFA